MRHLCWNAKGDWPQCCECDGRIHLAGCTSRRNPEKDCCPQRHVNLFLSGHERGLYDTAGHMLDGADMETCAKAGVTVPAEVLKLWARYATQKA